jgi:hypothetical protein
MVNKAPSLHTPNTCPIRYLIVNTTFLVSQTLGPQFVRHNLILIRFTHSDPSYDVHYRPLPPIHLCGTLDMLFYDVCYLTFSPVKNSLSVIGDVLFGLLAVCCFPEIRKKFHSSYVITSYTTEFYIGCSVAVAGDDGADKSKETWVQRQRGRRRAFSNRSGI